MPSFQERKSAALDLIQRVHAGQTRSGGKVPAWHHMARVSRVLESVLERTGEGLVEERQIIILAGLGHDAIEDTKVTDSELVSCFGRRGLEIIKGMTNRKGDADHSEYVRQVVGAEEAVRLVKFADLFDNCASVAFDLSTMGVKWTKEFFLPIVTPMIEAVLPTEFQTFPRAADELKSLVRVAMDLLLDELARFENLEK
jgi:(p)ppGpp synthase/HD superfamily hydrolase